MDREQIGTILFIVMMVGATCYYLPVLADCPCNKTVKLVRIEDLEIDEENETNPIIILPWQTETDNITHEKLDLIVIELERMNSKLKYMMCIYTLVFACLLSIFGVVLIRGERTGKK